MPKFPTHGDSGASSESSRVEGSILPELDPELITYVGKGIPEETVKRQVANVALEVRESRNVNWEKVEDWLSRNLPDSVPDIVYEPGSKNVHALVVRVKPTSVVGQAMREATEIIQKALTATGTKVDWSEVTLTPFWRTGQRGS